MFKNEIDDSNETKFLDSVIQSQTFSILRPMVVRETSRQLGSKDRNTFLAPEVT